MTNYRTHASAEFDEYASDYDAALARGISASGEDRDYFARGRIAWLNRRLRELNERPRSVLDFGCGTGSATRHFFELLETEFVFGVDSSARSLDIARRTFDSSHAQFHLFSDYGSATQVDLAFCNGVFHHIRPDERGAAVSYIYRCLRPGGIFAFWENNPWSLAARYVMSRIPFDRDAITLTPGEARRMLRRGGFEILGTDFQFIFPRALRWLRPIEPHVARFPLGSQYQVLCRKP